MAKKTNDYGQTWWGQQWLSALEAIDEDNRLPRGKTLASKGAVTKMQIKGGQVHSRVKDGLSIPPKQTISLPPFSAQEREAIVALFLEHELWLVELLSGHLSQQLLQEAESRGIHLLPHDWDELEMHCGCKDTSVPCKHLAACCYVMAGEIDQNPLLIFQLRGLDLLATLRQQGLLVSHQEMVYSLNSLLLDSSPGAFPTLDAQAFASLGFSHICDMGESIFSLLPERPLFSRRDFKEVLVRLYQQVSKKAPNLGPDNPDDYTDFLAKLKHTNDITLVMEPSMLLQNLLLCQPGPVYSPIMGSGKVFDSNDLAYAMMALPEEELMQYPPTVRLLHMIYLFSRKLMMERAYVPHLLEVDGCYTVRWQPAVLQPEVGELFDRFCALIPSSLLVLQDRRAQKTFFFSAQETLYMLCHFFIQFAIKEHMMGRSTRPPEAEESLYDCFFSDIPVEFDGAGEAEMPNTIQRWLSKLNLSHKRYAPLLCIEEEGSSEFLRFRVYMQVEDRQTAGAEPIPLEDFWEQRQYAAYKFEVIKDLRLLSEYLPELGHAIQAKGRHRIFYDEVEIIGLLEDGVPIIKLMGINILMPKSLRKLAIPQLSISLRASGEIPSEGQGSLKMEQLLAFDWRIAMGDQLVDVAEFHKLVEGQHRLIKVADQYVHFDAAEVQRLLVQLSKQAAPTGVELMQAALTGRYHGQVVALEQSAQLLVERLRQVPEIPLPQGLQAQLRPYQQRGYEWLCKNASQGLGSLIADDMGLGKTLQVIAALLKFKQDGLLEQQRALVIAPTSLLTNWSKELYKFAPELQVLIYHGSRRDLGKPFDVLVTSYGVLRTDLDTIKKLPLYCLVLDEAQNIKNNATAQTKAAKSVQAPVRIAMSGTPVENRLSEYWSIMDFLRKDYLGTLTHFVRDYARPIQKDRNQDRLQDFRRATDPFILRRLKSDKSIIGDLPDKIEQNLYCNLTKEQASLYQAALNDCLSHIKTAKGVSRKGQVLKMMTALKQICNHPFHFLSKGERSIESSGKAQMLFSILDGLQEMGEKALIFTQYREMGELIGSWVAARYGYPPLFLHGGCSRKQRDEMVEDFQHNHASTVFILSLKAGGTGLNLTAATHVIHYDLWWNPAVEAQATDRAYRIGQQNNVLVHRLITGGTFEEKIDDMLQRKKELANMTVSEGESWIGDLSDEELRALMELL